MGGISPYTGEPLTRPPTWKDMEFEREDEDEDVELGGGIAMNPVHSAALEQQAVRVRPGTDSGAESRQGSRERRRGGIPLRLHPGQRCRGRGAGGPE